MMKKIIVLFVVLVLMCGAVYGLLKVDWVARRVTPKKYWTKQILLYEKKLGRAKQVRFVKQIQLKKKMLTGDLDVAQDVALGIDEQISVEVVQGEIQKLQESVMDSEQAISNLETSLTDAKERLNSR